MIKNFKMVIEISNRTGLSLKTCKELLNAGWTFSQTVGQPDHWIAPISKLIKKD